MATTNFVRIWKDGERQFANVNGATVEIHSFSVEHDIVKLEFFARVAPSASDVDTQQPGEEENMTGSRWAS